MCADLRKFSGEPMGPATLGDDGSIAFYVTHRRDSHGEHWIELPDATNADGWGALMRVIPPSEIADIEVRATN